MKEETPGNSNEVTPHEDTVEAALQSMQTELTDLNKLVADVAEPESMPHDAPSDAASLEATDVPELSEIAEFAESAADSDVMPPSEGEIEPAELVSAEEVGGEVEDALPTATTESIEDIEAALAQAEELLDAGGALAPDMAAEVADATASFAAELTETVALPEMSAETPVVEALVTPAVSTHCPADDAVTMEFQALVDSAAAQPQVVAESPPRPTFVTDAAQQIPGDVAGNDADQCELEETVTARPVRRSASRRNSARPATDEVTRALRSLANVLMEEVGELWDQARLTLDDIVAQREGLETQRRALQSLYQQVMEMQAQLSSALLEAQRDQCQIRHIRDDAQRAGQRAEQAARDAQAATDRTECSAREAELAANHARMRCEATMRAGTPHT